MKKVTFLLLSLFCLMTLSAQKVERAIDSLIISGEFSEAITLTKKAISDFPDSDALKIRLSFSYRSNNQNREALSVLNNVQNQESFDYLCERGFVELKLKNNYSATNCFEMAQKIKPNNYKIARALSRLYFGKDDFKKALDQYKILEKLQPENSFMKQMIGRCLLKLKDFDNSILNFKNAIEADSLEIDNYYYLSAIYEGFKQRDSAEYILSKCVLANPKSGLAYKNFADFHSENGHYYRSIPLYEKSLDFPDDQVDYKWVTFEIGKELQKIKKNREAKSYLLDYWHIDSTNYEVNLYLSYVYKSENKLDSTLFYAKLASKHLAIDRNKLNAVQNQLVESYENNDQWGNALDVYKGMALIKGDYFNYYYNGKAGEILKDKLNKPDEALFYFEKALSQFEKSKVRPFDWKDYLTQQIASIKNEKFFKGE